MCSLPWETSRNFPIPAGAAQAVAGAEADNVVVAAAAAAVAVVLGESSQISAAAVGLAANSSLETHLCDAVGEVFGRPGGFAETPAFVVGNGVAGAAVAVAGAGDSIAAVVDAAAAVAAAAAVGERALEHFLCCPKTFRPLDRRAGGKNRSHRKEMDCSFLQLNSPFLITLKYYVVFQHSLVIFAI